MPGIIAMPTIRISYDYPAAAEVMRLIKDFDLVIEAQSFEAICVMVLGYKEKKCASVAREGSAYENPRSDRGIRLTSD